MTQSQILYLVLVSAMFILGFDRDFHRDWLARVSTVGMVVSTALSVSPAYAAHSAIIFAIALFAWFALGALYLVRSVRDGTTYVRFSFGKRKRSPFLKSV